MSKYRIKRFSVGQMASGLMKSLGQNSALKNAAIGAGLSAGGKMVANAVQGKDLTQGVGKAAAAGGIVGGAATGIKNMAVKGAGSTVSTPTVTSTASLPAASSSGIEDVDFVEVK